MEGETVKNEGTDKNLSKNTVFRNFLVLFRDWRGCAWLEKVKGFPA